jgi:hypothetical protein
MISNLSSNPESPCVFVGTSKFNACDELIKDAVDCAVANLKLTDSLFSCIFGDLCKLDKDVFDTPLATRRTWGVHVAVQLLLSGESMGGLKIL